jgi:hypothetical protein
MSANTPTPWEGRFPKNEVVSLLDVNPRFNMGESTAQDLTLGELMNLAGIDHIRSLRLGYRSSEGVLALRQCIGERVGVAPGSVLTTTGRRWRSRCLRSRYVAHPTRSFW